MYKVLLFKFMHYLCKGSMRQETQYEEFHSDNLGLATKIHVVSNRFFSHTLKGVSGWPQQASPQNIHYTEPMSNETVTI